MSSTRTLHRQEQILELLAAQGSVTVRELSTQLKVSEWTIRRDLDELAARHLLTRRYGMATLASSPEVEVFSESSLSDVRAQGTNLAAKQRIGRAAAALLHEGERVALGAGTTTTEVARALKGFNKRLSIVTNALNIALELADESGLDVTCTGGTVRGYYAPLMGPLAERGLKAYFFDVAVVGVSGITLAEGLTVNSQLNAELLQIMIQQSSKLMVVADHSKIGHVRFAHLAGLEAVDVWVTDTSPPPEWNGALRERNITVMVAQR